MVIASSPFDRYDEVAQVMFLPRGLQLGQGEGEFRTVVLDRGRRNKDLLFGVFVMGALEIRKPPTVFPALARIIHSE